MQTNLPDHLPLWENTTNWTPSPAIIEVWQKLYEEILTANQQFNLTRITSPEDFWEKNLWDSLAPILSYDLEGKKIIDIGTGAGFPALPIAIAFPHVKVTCMDSVAKKINFIHEIKKTLNLKNIDTLINRAEIVGHDKNHRQQYDFALIRAVGEISVCLEYTLPLIKINGIAILYRGNLTEDEREKIEQVSNILGGKIINITNQNTPINHHIRHCIYVKKTTPTAKIYPREVGKPSKQPLS